MPDKVTAEQRINLLSELEREAVVSQQSLAKRLAVSAGLINALMKRAVRKGLVKVKTAPRKRYAYYLTPRGLGEKSRLVAKYLEDSLSFFRLAKQEYADLFSGARAQGATRFILIGRGELADIAAIAARETGVNLIGVFDRDANIGDISDLPVIRDISGVEAGCALVLTASRSPQAEFDGAGELFPDHPVLAPGFLKLSPPSSSETAER